MENQAASGTATACGNDDSESFGLPLVFYEMYYPVPTCTLHHNISLKFQIHVVLQAVNLI
jgi:hypothetical protein